jgi:hypothetical protein
MIGVLVGGLFATAVALFVFVIMHRLARREREERERAGREPDGGVS